MQFWRDRLRTLLVTAAERACFATASTALFVLVISPAQVHAGPVISVSSSRDNIDAIIDWLPVTVRIDDVASLRVYQFRLTFDPRILEASMVLEGHFLSDFGQTQFATGVIDNVGGQIRGIQNFLVPNVFFSPRGGELLTVFFFVRQPGSTTVSVVIDPSRGDVVLDGRFQPLDVATVAGQVVIDPSLRVPEPRTSLLMALVLLALVARRAPRGEVHHSKVVKLNLKRVRRLPRALRSNAPGEPGIAS